MGKFIFMFIVFSSLIHSQSDSLKELLNFYPLQNGNYWEYEMTVQQIPYPAEYYAFSDEVIGDTLLENNVNYKVIVHKDIYPNHYVSYKYERIDSITGCVYQHRNDTSLMKNEFKMDSLFSQAGDTISSSRDGYSSFGYFRTICRSTGMDTLFGIATQTKTFENQSAIPAGEYKLAKGFGFCQGSACEFSCGWTSLVYAKIGGIEYGNKIITESDKYLDSLKCYYPLEIGDKWIFDRYDTDGIENSSCQWSLEVVEDTIMSNGKTYKKLVNTLYNQKSITISYERIDSSEAKVFRYDPAADSLDYENLILDFSMKKGDTLRTSFWEITFTEENEIIYFNKTIHTREYSHLHGFMGYGDQYLKNIGLYKYMFAGDFFESISFLKGCIVNNIQYGDTTISSVYNDTENLQSSFHLSQNYPNPFNPVTRIKYSIPHSGLVSIIIYDILGKEILNLVNQYTNAGDHEIEFNAGNLSSGVYFYKMKCDDFSKTRRLLLLK